MNRLIWLCCLLASSAAAQQRRDAPISNTEDASLGSVEVGDGRWHPVFDVDVRNADFVRGSYDDDAVGLDQVPVHAQLGVVYEVTRNADGAANGWLMLRSSNGFHAPSSDERQSPRAWYESNNLVGVAARLAPALNGALTYTVKTSPNDVSGTTHELSAALALAGDGGFAALHPGLVATWRPRGGGGYYTQAMIEPGWALPAIASGSRLSIPTVLGVGCSGFYEAGSRNRVYGSTGVAWKMPLPFGGGHWSAHAEALALVRDRGLRDIGGPRANHGAVEPYVTLRLSYSD